MEKMSLADVKDFLRDNFRRETEVGFGLKDVQWVDRVTNNWFDDKNNYDGRWRVIEERVSKSGQILDIAAGCGTFILFGLHNEYNVWGVEPEEWKREYFKRKIVASNYPAWFLNHFIAGVGESLPFEDEYFDLVTTYQTLEHVQRVNVCIQEMLRVLKPGGILFIRAPDYNCFFEPHYRVPFLPKMNKKLASIYLRLIGRPVQGLQALQWVTERKVVKLLRDSKYSIIIESTTDHFSRRREKIRESIPKFLRNTLVIRLLHFLYEIKIALARIGRQEKNINLWVTKIR